ncbi:MAG: nucleoside 2-deoxyribosyltransferase [Candidatus Heimdallarchaeota archaeon]
MTKDQSPMLKIYFAGSIRGGREDVELYRVIIEHLKTHGEVFTVHVGDPELDILGGEIDTDEDIHNRDLNWLFASDIVVAEVSQPSLGVGYEIGRAIEQKKSILCLYRPKKGKYLSAMIKGSQNLVVKEYQSLEEAKRIIDTYIQGII